MTHRLYFDHATVVDFYVRDASSQMFLECHTDDDSVCMPVSLKFCGVCDLRVDNVVSADARKFFGDGEIVSFTIVGNYITIVVQWNDVYSKKFCTMSYKFYFQEMIMECSEPKKWE